MTHTMKTSPDVVPGAVARSHARRLGSGVYVSATLVLLLLGYGWSLVPAVAPIAPSTVLVAYVVVAHLAVVWAKLEITCYLPSSSAGGPIRFSSA